MFKIQSQGHWPEFDQVLCGDMTDRQRLGLPDYYVADRFSDMTHSLYAQLNGLSAQALVELIENQVQTLPIRLVAGNLLALLGDPRIDTTNPAMIEIPASQAWIGLDHAAVTQVLLDFDKLGLNASWIEKECPRHQVTLVAYRIGKYPVTNQEYRDFLIEAQYPEIPSSWSFRRFPIERSNHPVYTLSAQACDAYVDWLSKKTGRDFHLPTEAQWEFATSGNDNREFPWGSEFNVNYTNTCETGIFDTTPVGIFHEGVSYFSVHDMAGNVEEYVADSYQAYPNGNEIEDHLSQIHGEYRVARGGSFARFRDLARNRRRHGHNPRSQTYAMGFRLAERI